MKNKYRILKIFITVVVLGFLLSFSLKRFGNQKITDDKVSVRLNNQPVKVYFVDEKNVREMVKKENPSGKVGALNIPDLEKKISAIPAVDSANVYLNLNGHLNLNIVQRVPVFRLINGDKDFYVDEKGNEFPVYRNYSHPCMLVTGKIKPEEYQELAKLVQFIDKDDFSKKYFIGISKDHNGYNLLTSDGYYKVEIGDLDGIELKVQGFKTFVKKFLVFQDPQKYNKISVKYNNQIVTTLNPFYKENDSLLKVGAKELAKAPESTERTTAPPVLTAEKKKEIKTAEKPREKPKEKKKSDSPKPEKKAASTKPKSEVKKKEAPPKESKPKAKAKVKIE